MKRPALARPVHTIASKHSGSTSDEPFELDGASDDKLLAENHNEGSNNNSLRVQELIAELHSELSRRGDVEQQLGQARTEIAQLRGQLHDARNELVQAVSTGEQAKEAELQRRVGRLTAMLHDANAEKLTLEEDVDRLDGRIRELERQLAAQRVAQNETQAQTQPQQAESEQGQGERLMRHRPQSPNPSQGREPVELPMENGGLASPTRAASNRSRRSGGQARPSERGAVVVKRDGSYVLKSSGNMVLNDHPKLAVFL